MRIVILRDFNITDEEWKELETELTNLYKKHTPVTPEFYIEEHDFSAVPTEVDPDGDIKPSGRYRQELADDVYSRYGEFGTDHVVMMVHEDNWIFKGIWGQNWSNVYHSYHFELCRFDKDNVANSLGTFYHELMHSHDALIHTTIGVDINNLRIAPSWDKFCVHGGRPDKEGVTDWEYIKYKENTEALKAIGLYLHRSYEKRRSLHMKKIGMMTTIVSLAQKVLVLLRAKVNKKNGSSGV